MPSLLASGPRPAGRLKPLTLLLRRAAFSPLCLGLLAAACQTPGRPASNRERLAAAAAAQSNARTRALHERLVTIDSHSAAPLHSCGATDLQVDFPKMRAGGLDVAFYVVFAAQQKRTDSTYGEAKRQALSLFESIRNAVGRCQAEVALVRTPDDVERAVETGMLAVGIGIENGFVIGRDLSLLKTYRDLGVAYIGLAHEGHNDIADSATPRDELGDSATEHGGVSEFGRQAIAAMNQLGIMVDVSHLSKVATLDAIRHSRAPVIASHSSVHAIVPTPRNMDDETLLALAAKGGVIQVTAVHSFVKVDPPNAIKAFSALLDEFTLETDAEAKELPPDRRRAFEARLAQMERRWALATVMHMVDHIDYAVGLVGVDHVGIGSDFEGGGGLTGWTDASEGVNVTAELLRRGYTEEEIRKIWGGNLLRVWREVRRLPGLDQ